MADDGNRTGAAKGVSDQREGIAKGCNTLALSHGPSFGGAGCGRPYDVLDSSSSAFYGLARNDRDLGTERCLSHPSFRHRRTFGGMTMGSAQGGLSDMTKAPQFGRAAPLLP